jgi:hypothetical protein
MVNTTPTEFDAVAARGRGGPRLGSNPSSSGDEGPRRHGAPRPPAPTADALLASSVYLVATAMEETGLSEACRI